LAFFDAGKQVPHTKATMQEFLSLYSKIEHPTLEMVLFTFLLTFLLSGLIAFTYERTSPHTIRNPNFMQAIILSALAASTIMQAIGDSVATGLGMLGALAIIRFRTTLRDPRDIVFMFATLGAGLACGVYGFYIAIIGTGGFCVVAFALWLTPYNIGNNTLWELRVRMPDEDVELQIFEEVLAQYCKHWNQHGMRAASDSSGQAFLEYDYVVIMRQEKERRSLLQALANTQTRVRRFSKQTEINPFA